MSTSVANYFDRAMNQLRDLGLVPEKQDEKPVVALLNRLTVLDENELSAWVGRLCAPVAVFIPAFSFISNFGTLARERAMLLPFILMLIAFKPPPKEPDPTLAKEATI